MSQYVICCGMSRSGGTAQYQMAKALVERHGLGQGDGFGVHHNPGNRPREWIVVKVERADERWVRAAEQGRGVALGIYRDPRDVAASLMEFRRRQGEMWPHASERTGTFADILPDLRDALAWWDSWERHCAYTVSYEQAVTDWPYVVLRMAGALGIQTTAGECIDIATEWCIVRNRNRCEQQEKWLDGYKTMLTRAHIGERMGMVGRWQDELTDEQVQAVEGMAGKGWMVAHGYRLLDR